MKQETRKSLVERNMKTRPHRSSLRYCTKTKGEHLWEEQTSHPKYKNFDFKWHKSDYFHVGKLVRWRYLICTKCKKQNFFLDKKDAD